MGQTLRRTGPQMKRSGGAIAPAVLAKKKAPARDIPIDEPETDELRAFGGSRSDKFNGVLINALARTGWFPPGQTDEACSQQMFAAVAALRAFKPTDEIEGMLAAQTVAMPVSASGYTVILVPQWQTPYMDATGAFLDCYVIPWGRPSEEPGHR